MQTPSNENCFHWMHLGNCFNRKQCQRNHPDIFKEKTKLKFKKDEFKPKDNYILSPPVVIPKIPKATACSCCFGDPKNCKKLDQCKSFGQCFCRFINDYSKMLRESEDNINTCNCCHGHFMNCQEIMCRQLGICQCKMREIMDDNTMPMDQFEVLFLPEYSDCPCCNGYVDSCDNNECKQLTHCFCLL